MFLLSLDIFINNNLQENFLLLQLMYFFSCLKNIQKKTIYDYAISDLISLNSNLIVLAIKIKYDKEVAK